ncbi:hypothetical protein JWJ88_06370 [Paracoccus methylovorus]|uniref:HIG1 domain-containing protein n=1 Tax=Paracoccus methylovorus TaxID=2812658 RepID=A0ABX7JJK6_9RHOB|nr:MULTISPECIES: hypothetical protein [Paracoccus]QRZ14210.1 hypothetical protein JWJ88_06370 [Paracoccus methylovorus]
MPLDRGAGAGYALPMIVIAAFILGAVIGWMRAAKAGGNRADQLQYAAAHALALTVLGIFLTIFISRMG